MAPSTGAAQNSTGDSKIPPGTALATFPRARFTSARVFAWRWLAVGVILFLVALHQIFLSGILVHIAPAWRVPVEVAVYGVTGIVAAWLALTTLANALAHRERVESELRAAFAELEFNHRKLLALNELGKHVSDANHEETVLELAAQGAVELTDARASSVVTFDDTGNRLKLDMAWGLSDRYLRAMRVKIDQGVSAARCRECSKLKTPASSDCPLFVGLHDEARAEGIGSLICLPILREQERVGIIAAYFPTVEGPPEDHIRLLNILGGVIANALDSVRRRTRQVDTLHALDRASQNAQQLNDLAAQVLDIAASGWEAQSGGIFLYDPTTQTWMCRARRELGDDLADARFQLGLQLAQAARQTGAPVVQSSVAPNGHGLLSVVAAPFIIEDETFGAIFLASKRQRTFTDNHIELLATMAHQIALAIRNAQLYARVEQMALFEERYRLSREIHDGLAQTLSCLGLQAERLDGLIATGRNDATLRELAEMRQSIHAAYVDVREAIDGLRLSVNDPRAIAARLTEYVEEFARQSGIAARFSAEPNDATVAPEIGMQLLRIAQEALTNVRKHAHARSVLIALGVSATEIEMTITDDGRGLPDASQAGRAYHSHGLAIMRERAQSLGGVFTVATGPGQGTRIAVVIPTKKRS